MRKTDKKIDNALRVALTEACELAKDKYEGFEWLTHFANYDQFPKSLSIVCVYDTNENLNRADREDMLQLIKQHLASINIKVKDIRQHVRFDTEENCAKMNEGKWQERLSSSRSNTTIH